MRRSDLADRLREWAVAGGMNESQARSMSNNAMIRRYAVRLGPMELFDNDEAVSMLVRQADDAEEFVNLITTYIPSNTPEKHSGQATSRNA